VGYGSAMMKRRAIMMVLRVAAGVCLCVAGTEAAAAQIRVGAAVQKDIYVGEPFQYQIIVDGHDGPGQADVSVLAAWSVQSQGGRDLSQRSVTIRNGRRSEQVVKRYLMAYLLTASQAGSATLPAVSVEVEGRTYQTNALSIDVLSPQTTDKLDLEITVSQTDVYVGQPITCTVTWYIDGTMVNGVGDFDFAASFLEQSELWRVVAAGPPGGGDKAFELKVGGQVVVVSQRSCKHDGRDCLALSWQRILIPQQAGERSLGAHVASKVDTSTRRRRVDPLDVFGSRRDRRSYQRFLTTAAPVAVSVKALPGAGRPADFAGLVGRYTIATEAQPTEVNVGDPITLTIRISGELPREVTMPELESVEALAKDFKIPSDQSAPKVVAQAKVFTQTIRPMYETIKAIPAIPLSYFDVDGGRYVTVRSEPIPLEVMATRVVTAAEGIGAGPVGVRAKAITAVEGGIAANYEGPALLENRAFSLGATLVNPLVVGLWGAPLVLLAVVFVAERLRADNPERRRAQLQATACKRAVRRLKHVSAGGSDVADEVADVLRQYMGERCDRVAQSLTVRDCRELLGARGCQGRGAAAFCEVLERCENSRYAGGHGESKVEPREAARCVAGLEEELKACRKG